MHNTVILGGNGMHHNDEENEGKGQDGQLFETVLSERTQMSTEAHNPTTESRDYGDASGELQEPIDASAQEESGSVAKMFYMQNLDRNFAPRTDEWNEPTYSQTHESTSRMYTPGIYVEQQHSRRRNVEPEPERIVREDKVPLREFLRSACLVLVCAIASAAASNRVMEYRFNRGDFAVVNQVVLGGTANGQQNSSLSNPVSAWETGMLAEDIYVMACTQVVSISTQAESSSSLFGSIIPSTTSLVSGSGFIISSDGYILTNFHVVETAFEGNLPLIVSLNDGTSYEATVIGYEMNNDVALIKIPVSGLNPAIIANSDSIKVGQTVYAVGNPLGELVYTMTDGIVSARDREVSVDGKTINTFQFSAAVNLGNSGGPLYDTKGEVIGIVTAKPRQATVEGIGFAIPINDAIEIARELIEFGYITGRPLLGIEVQTVFPSHAEYWGWVIGARVKTVFAGSAAEKAGMLVGDIITKLGTAEIDSTDALRYALRRCSAGETTTLTIWRDGETIELTITFDEDLAAGQARS